MEIILPQRNLQENAICVAKLDTKLQTVGKMKRMPQRDQKDGNHPWKGLMLKLMSKVQGELFRMYNPNTKRILITRDVIWLRHMYFHRFEPAANRFYHTSIDATKVKEGDDINETSDANNEENDEMTINVEEENRNEKTTDRNKSVV